MVMNFGASRSHPPHYNIASQGENLGISTGSGGKIPRLSAGQGQRGSLNTTSLPIVQCQTLKTNHWIIGTM